MRKIAALAGALTAIGPAAHAQETPPAPMETLAAVSPALHAYTQDDLFGSVWGNESLSPRDRSLLTVAALIARSESEGLAQYLDYAVDNGVTAAELSETITHLAFYAGWQNAMKAAAAAADVFAARGVTADELPAAEPADMLPLDQEVEDQRQSFVQERFGNVSQGVVDNTEQLLFLDLWQRPALAPRDRSLVTVSALIATGKVEQVTFHLNRAMDNGLTKEEASAALAHLAFYAGWPNIFSAMPVVKEVFDSREG
ncbi:carboxymuconolactone decarboxylase family protein [Acuticoccus sp. M5D2P5]|uniref:carboxymuconolactone decarboxylase family protein n=1 Tax=Acuticoccus kalidii TaxID=2910977 RepID=UPI001F2AAE90|nr:carboxymuconolactone decarboxylase family protein [Acuticoccus kalidii]MCF3934976.1 carboxymuconolactone decarboxylase family protein [Acuticoccus kalidii]